MTLPGSIGFFGGGRVTRILLGGLSRAGVPMSSITVSDPQPKALAKIREGHAQVVCVARNVDAACADLLFVAVPLPEVLPVLAGVVGAIPRHTRIVSLAPRVTSVEIAKAAGGRAHVVRMIPNAGAIVGRGFSPISFFETFPEVNRPRLIAFLSKLGDVPVVAETELEAWAIVTAMAPTYFWFQMLELARLGGEHGLQPDLLRRGIAATMSGSAAVLQDSGLSPEEVLDLVPGRPLGPDEETIRQVYRQRLEPLFAKLRPLSVAVP